MFSLLESFYRILVKNLPITFLKNPKSQLLYTYFKLTKPRIIKKEINSLLINKEKEIVFFYDLTNIKNTYGDFIFTIYSFRLLKTLNFNPIIYINLKSNEDKYLSNDEYIKKINFRKELQKLSSRIENVSSEKIILCEKIEDIKISNDNYLIFSDFGKKKRPLPLYRYLHDFNNSLYKKFPKQSFLLNKENFEKESKLDFEYITVAFRYNNEFSSNRNSKIIEFQEIINTLKRNFNYKIVVVSDNKGCTFLRKLINKGELPKDLFISKDITTSFYEDWRLIVNSRIFFQFNAGGLAILAIYSNIPYLIYGLSKAETHIKKDSLCYWSNKYQKKINSKNLKNFLKDIKLFKNI